MTRVVVGRKVGSEDSVLVIRSGVVGVAVRVLAVRTNANGDQFVSLEFSHPGTLPLAAAHRVSAQVGRAAAEVRRSEAPAHFAAPVELALLAKDAEPIEESGSLQSSLGGVDYRVI